MSGNEAKERIYKWERYWFPRGKPPQLIDGGYLPDPKSKWMDRYTKHLLPFESIDNVACAALLGEPGIGKSNEIKTHYERVKEQARNSGDLALLFNLRDFQTDDRLCTDVFEQNPAFQAWVKGKNRLYLFLDSLDEGLLAINPLATLLIKEFKKYPIDRLYLRIACRTAEWPSVLENGLVELWGKNNFKVFELAPLRRIDVIEAARINQINDSDLFLQAIWEKEIVPLAFKPVTLDFLIKLYTKNKQFPQAQAELYAEGCRLLCDELNESRIASYRAGRLSVEKRLVLAERIAATSIFGNRSAIWTSKYIADAPEEDVTIRELFGGQESSNEGPFWVDETAIREVLDTGLFIAYGADRMGWVHQTYAEFLAARYIERKQLTLGQRVSFFLLAGDSERRLIPQLYECAAWLASIDSDAFREFMKTDPQVLLRSDAATADTKDKKALVDTLLILYDEEKIRLNTWLFNEYKKLCHPELTEQLRPYIIDKNKGDVRQIAITMAEACKLQVLQDSLVDIALDDSELPEVRIAAARTLIGIGGDDFKKRLKPLVSYEVKGDEEKNLKGYALQAVWPNFLTAEELFNALTNVHERSYGLYQRFISDHIIEHLQPADLKVALEWVERQNSSDRLPTVFRKLVDEIMLKSWENLETPDVLESFARAALSRLKYYDDVVTERRTPFDDLIDTPLRPRFSELVSGEDTKRRSVLMELVSICLTSGRDSLRLSAHRNPFVISKDLYWMIGELEASDSESIRTIWAMLIRDVFDWNDTDQYEAVFKAYERNPFLTRAFSYLFRPIDLNSEEAREMRTRHEEAKKWQKREQPLVSPPPSERIATLLERGESGDTSAWWQLNLEMTLEPNSTHYGSDYQSNLKVLPGWKAADAETRFRIIEMAKLYVLEHDPGSYDWLGTDTIDLSAFAGYKALRLLFEEAPEFLSTIASSVWNKWAPMILAFPTSSDSGEDKLQKELIAIAYYHAPEEIIEVLESSIDKENSGIGFIPTLEKIDKVWDERIARLLLGKLKSEELKPASLSALLRKLAEYGVAEALDFARSQIPLSSQRSEDQLSKSIVSARMIIEHTEDAGWPIIWPAIQINNDFAKKLIESLSYVERHDKKLMPKLTDVQLADLYIWISENYPHAEDPQYTGSYTVGPRESVRFLREGILQYLRDRGTIQACESIERIGRELPHLDYMKWVLLDAKQNMRRKTWNPLAPKEFLALVNEWQESKAQTIEVNSNFEANRLDILNLIWDAKPVDETVNLYQFLNLYQQNPSRVVPFVGAGLSRPLFPPWDGILERMIEECAARKKLNYPKEDLLSKLKGRTGDDYLDLASICANALGPTDYREFLEGHFDIDFSLESIPLAYQELLSIDTKAIITTNYDRIPDAACNRSCRIFTNRQAGEAGRALEQNKPIIVKLHGSITDHESIIFTREDYNRVMFLSPNFEGFLDNILRSKTTLFLGFGLSDPHISRILSLIHTITSGLSVSHYALMAGLSQLDIDITEKKYGIKIISYKPSDDTHPEVLEFIRLMASVRKQSS